MIAFRFAVKTLTLLFLQLTMSGNAVAKIAKPELRGALIKQIKLNIVGAFIGATLVTGTW
jgi:hypothetical protein